VDRDKLEEERSELAEKLGRLNEFLEADEFFRLGSSDQSLLESQAQVMKAYIDILGARLGAVEEETWKIGRIE